MVAAVFKESLIKELIQLLTLTSSINSLLDIKTAKTILGCRDCPVIFGSRSRLCRVAHSEFISTLYLWLRIFRGIV